jgi:Fe-S cluster assembly protein SufD
MEAVTESKVLSFVDALSTPETLTNTRKESLQALNAMEFPTTRVEEWKYTRVGRIANKKFTQGTPELNTERSAFTIDKLDAHVLVFVNGHYRHDLSEVQDKDGLTIQSIDELEEKYYAGLVEDTEENVFSLINKAYQTGGVHISVDKNTKVEKPIHLLHVISGDQTIANVRHFLEVKTGAEVEVITSYHSENAKDAFSNHVLEGHVGQNARLTINKIQREEKSVFNITNELFIQDKDSNFKINTITTGSLLTRNGLNVLVEGENCYTEMNGAYLGNEKQHLDNHTLIDQMYSNCVSSETYKGVMDDKSVGVFNGKVIVRQDAQKIEAYQSNGNILLSDTATVNSKPELEIYADDVRCSHGSTTGQIDEEAIFYLRSRGISKQNARKLMVAAFIGDVLDKIDNEAVRANVDALFLEEYGWKF